MTDKITIQFNEIKKNKQKTVQELIGKPYAQVTQKDLLDVRNLINYHRNCYFDQSDQKQMMERLLNMQLDSRLYKPIDQRSFIKYVIDIIYDWVHENLDYDTQTFNADNVFDCYYADGTMTYNTQETLNYIRSFWDEFHEDDLEDTDAKFVFEQPEAFFVQQCYYMSVRILEAIFESQEVYNKQAFLDYVDNDFIPSKMAEFIY